MVIDLGSADGVFIHESSSMYNNGSRNNTQEYSSMYDNSLRDTTQESSSTCRGEVKEMS